MIKKWIFLFALLSVTLLTSCKTKDVMRAEYLELTDANHIFEVVGVDKVLSMIDNKETGIIVLGFKECPWCQKIVPYVNEVAKEKEFDVVYYVDIKDMRDNTDSLDHAKYLQMQETFSVVLDKVRNRINAPTTIMLKDGNVTGYHLNTVSTHVKNDNNILPPLTSEQEEELKTILRNIFTN